jgi:cytidylate kinase
MIITIDGPSGTGKSTVAKTLASRIGFVFFDTGAMYRAVTYKLLKEQISLTDTEHITSLLKDLSFKIETVGQEKRYFLGEEDVTTQIRTQQVTRHASEVSALPVIREALVALQRRFASGINAVFEGRDMGTVVFPNADLKVYLTAIPEIRAERRFREFLFKHPSEAENLTKQQVLEDILRRDTIDSTRENSPLCQAENAHLIDTTHLTVDEVVDKILALLLHIQ